MARTTRPATVISPSSSDSYRHTPWSRSELESCCRPVSQVAVCRQVCCDARRPHSDRQRLVTALPPSGSAVCPSPWLVLRQVRRSTVRSRIRGPDLVLSPWAIVHRECYFSHRQMIGPGQQITMRARIAAIRHVRSVCSRPGSTSRGREAGRDGHYLVLGRLDADCIEEVHAARAGLLVP